jgi:hypothetical protein
VKRLIPLRSVIELVRGLTIGTVTRKICRRHGLLPSDDSSQNKITFTSACSGVAVMTLIL